MSSFRWIQGKDYERKQQAPGLMLRKYGKSENTQVRSRCQYYTHLVPECNKSWEPLEKWMLPNSEDPCVNFIVDRFEQMSSSEYTNNRPMYGAIHVPQGTSEFIGLIYRHRWWRSSYSKVSPQHQLPLSCRVPPSVSLPSSLHAF